MTKRIAMGTAALALLASVSLAAAQNPSAAGQTQPTQNQPAEKMAGQEPINLTEQQKQTIWQTLSKAKVAMAPSNFQASVGADVPKSMRLHYFKRSLTKEVPTMRGYEYTKLQNQVLIVDPRTRRVIDTVSGS
jgi:hypothetical protein